MYDNGEGVIKDAAEAVNWYRKAADQGISVAQSNLAFMYGKGRGVIKDYILAHMWWNIAASKGAKAAAGNRDIIEKKMTAADISKATQKAKRCLKSYYKDCE